jgi:hypothetical protein
MLPIFHTSSARALIEKTMVAASAAQVTITDFFIIFLHVEASCEKPL